VTGLLNGLLTSFADAEQGITALERLHAFARLPPEPALVLPRAPGPYRDTPVLDVRIAERRKGDKVYSSILDGGHGASSRSRISSGNSCCCVPGSMRRNAEPDEESAMEVDRRAVRSEDDGDTEGREGRHSVGSATKNECCFDPPESWPQKGALQFDDVYMR